MGFRQGEVLPGGFVAGFHPEDGFKMLDGFPEPALAGEAHAEVQTCASILRIEAHRFHEMCQRVVVPFLSRCVRNESE